MSEAPAVYRRDDVTVYIATRFFSVLAMMVQSVAVGWQVYDIVGDPLALGLVGLSEFVPMFLLTLPAGEISDRFDQRKVLAISLIVEALCSGLLLLLTFSNVHSALPFYGVMLLFGAARAFSGPASQSLLPFLVPAEGLPKAIAWGSSAFQVAVIAGPAAGGFIYALGAGAAYGLCLAAFLAAAVGVMILGGRRRADVVITASRLERVKEGIRFVRARPVVLGAISLDLFAVLLGGATALLPVFARDILAVGPVGLGVLRSAPAVGATLMALYLTRWPVRRDTGVKMFAAVAIFGVATVVFGLSRDFYLSLFALAVLGASDQISVFVRTSLIQYATPDEMRGRVSAVNMLFIGASNELGEFESGLTASWFGTVPAVVMGGVGTLVIVAVWMKLFPPLRTVDRLMDVAPK